MGASAKKEIEKFVVEALPMKVQLPAPLVEKSTLLKADELVAPDMLAFPILLKNIFPELCVKVP